jgi:hypothetical protein
MLTFPELSIVLILSMLGMTEFDIKFESVEWDEIEKRIVGQKRKQSSFFLKLLNLKLKRNGVRCVLIRKYI